MTTKTKAFFEKFKGYPTFAVWEVDENEKKVYDKPIVSIGTKKALALANHPEEFKQFIEQALKLNKEKEKVA